MTAAQSHRLAHGGLIDRAAPLSFTFDGKPFAGFPGDTLASALVANGVKLVGRSFKYHRPRGILTAGSEEPNALVELRSGARREPNTKATTVELYDGARSRQPEPLAVAAASISVSVNQLFSPIFVAGFYYKTFMWPAKFWETIYEPVIRRAAGLGRAAGRADPDHYEKAWAHCDVLVVGGGPAGLDGGAGRRPRRRPRHPVRGGLRARRPAAVRRRRRSTACRRRLGRRGAGRTRRRCPMSASCRRTTVFGVYDGGTYGALERVNDHLPVAARASAAPAALADRRQALRSSRPAPIERPIVFAGNDTPGVMMASAVRTYVKRYRRAAGQAHRAVHQQRRWLAHRRDAHRRRLAGRGRHRCAPGHCGRRIARWRRRPASPCSAASVDRRRRRQGRRAHVAVALGRQRARRGRGRWARRVRRLEPGGRADLATIAAGRNGATTSPPSCPMARRPAWWPPAPPMATFGLGALPAPRALRPALRPPPIAAINGNAGAPPIADDEAFSLTPLWHVAGKGKAFVDCQNDVTASDIELAQREGFESVEHLKRYTTLGMATDQGKTSNVDGPCHHGGGQREIHSRDRHDHLPAALRAGGDRRLCRPSPRRELPAVRLTPSHHWAAEQGAVFVDTGLWKRAQWYPQPGETDWLESVTREVKAVRGGVGFCDVSTLGKIDVHGPDAGAFLDRVYINTFSNLAVGKARYGLMLREDGIVYDDGTTSRLAEDHYFLTTTTAKAGLVMQHLEFCRQVLLPELDVQLTSVTDQWAQFSIAGPQARATCCGRSSMPCEDLSNEGFPFMGARGSRAARRHSGAAVPHLLLGRDGLRDFGAGALRRGAGAQPDERRRAVRRDALRHRGARRHAHREGPCRRAANSTARRPPADLGLGKMMSTKKDFIGRVMAGREALVAPDRQVVVGIKPVDRARRLRSGAHIIPKGRARRTRHRPGLCHLGLLLADARPVDRAGAGRARPRAHRRDRAGARSTARRGLRGRTLQSRLLRSGRRAPAWLSFHGSRAARWNTRSFPARMARATASQGFR